jgi:hypothetical protein
MYSDQVTPNATSMVNITINKANKPNKSKRRRSSLSCSFLNSPSYSPRNRSRIQQIKDKYKKENYYKLAKQKRALILEKTRHLNDVNLNEDESYDKLSVQSESTFSMNLKEECKENFENYQAMNEQNMTLDSAVKTEPQIDLKDNELIFDSKSSESNIQGTKTKSKFTSAISSRLNSFRNTLKNIVLSSNKNVSNANSALPCQPDSLKESVQKPVLNIVKINKLKPDDTLSSLKRMNSSVGHSANNQLKKQFSARNMPASKQNSTLQASQQYRSSSNLTHMNNRFSSAQNISSGSSDSRYASSHTSSSSLHSNTNRPVFKITKIKYDDRHLYNSVGQNQRKF